jgi:outer membrane protein OmpA-like peptidoglycan-associated protein
VTEPEEENEMTLIKVRHSVAHRLTLCTLSRGLAVLVSIPLVACGATLAPRELSTARQEYSKAKQGEAAQYAPAQLEEARQALDAAENTFDKRGDKPETRDAAYLALRKVEIANAAGAVEAAQRRKVTAQKDLEDLRAQNQELTQSQLSQTQAALEAEKRRREREEEARQKTQAELEKERQARVTAEGKLAAAIASLDKMAQVKEEKRGIVITLSGAVLFTTGKWDLLPIAQQKLDDVAKALKDQGYKKLVVEGHTDSRGSDKDNQDLSQKRADSVRSHLVSRGIEADKITAVGIGEARPVADNASEEGRANNRRVEIIVTPE